MNAKALGLRLVSVFVAAAVPNIAIGSAVGVEVWKAAAMAGGVAVLGVLQALALAYKADGKVEPHEIESAFNREG